jgi:GNAT superfamily N-acetyltransferase
MTEAAVDLAIASCAPAVARAPGPAGIGTRPIAAGDMDFLCSLYASTRTQELAATGWPEAAQRQFLAQQFDFQHRYYQEHHADAEFLLLLRHDRPIGRLYWRARPAQATLIDVSLLPDQRGQGLGSALLQDLTARADRQGQDIDLHVEPANPARRLYERFAFTAVDVHGVYLHMRRTPLR